MAERDRPLPTPPRPRFGGRLPEDQRDEGPLTADRLAQAAAEGLLEEFLQREIPEGEHARNLAMMMLGMSGLAPQGMTEAPRAQTGDPPSGAEPAGGASCAAPAAPDEPGEGDAAVPPEVLAAAMQGDVAGLMALLRDEHVRRGGGGEPAAVPASPQTPGGEPAAAARAGFDKALIDELLSVAAENHIGVDWLLLRALKLYLEEHRRTGRL